MRIGSPAFAGALHGKPFPKYATVRLGAHTLVALADETGWLGAFAPGESLGSGQFDDLDGPAQRILDDDD